MSKVVNRGYVQSDSKEFGMESIPNLKEAGTDLYYLLNRGYNIKSATEYVGNHYLLTTRQRFALMRAISTNRDLSVRSKKEIVDTYEGLEVNIDGFNTIITLEVALSGSFLFKGMDGTIRDLAGLRGNYHIIDKTEEAIQLIGDTFEKFKIIKANFYLDAPVSNSGRLKGYIYEVLENKKFKTNIYNINRVDSVLENLSNVITSDSIILDKCKSWINLNEKICRDISINKSIFIDFQRLILNK